MKIAVPALALAASMLASPALAQSSERQFDAGRHYPGGLGEPDTQVLAFIRIPFGEDGQHEREPKIGFGLFTDCGRTTTRLSSQHSAACEDQQIRSLEVSRKLTERDWLISFAGTRRWVGLARWYPQGGFARVQEYGPVLSGPRLGDEAG